MNEEWIQIRNLSGQDTSLQGLSLMHWTYSGHELESATNTEVLKLSGALTGRTSLRIHSGPGKAYIDPKTGIVHIFANSTGQFNYQISRPDCITLAIKNRSLDYARYDPPLAEGKRLRRGNLDLHTLVP